MQTDITQKQVPAHVQPPRSFANRWLKQWELQSMVWPGIFFILLFNIIPLYGLLIAFKDYNIAGGVKGVFTSPWAGFEYFRDFFTDMNFRTMMKNTLGINALSLIIGFPLTIVFAMFLNEIASSKFKKATQTITYLPHFISWVIYGGLIISLLSPSTGVVNYLLLQLGLIDKPIEFLATPEYFWPLAVVTQFFKELGWGAILFLAAIAGVDQEMYEAAYMDGAGRFKRMFYITLPSIMGTVMILLIFRISGILNSGFDQIYVFQNPLNIDASEVIDTYVYKVGIQQFQMEYATAVGLFKSVIALVLLVGANFASKKITNRGIF